MFSKLFSKILWGHVENHIGPKRLRSKQRNKINLDFINVMSYIG